MLAHYFNHHGWEQPFWCCRLKHWTSWIFSVQNDGLASQRWQHLQINQETQIFQSRNRRHFSSPFLLSPLHPLWRRGVSAWVFYPIDRLAGWRRIKKKRRKTIVICESERLCLASAPPFPLVAANFKCNRRKEDRNIWCINSKLKLTDYQSLNHVWPIAMIITTQKSRS